MPATTNRLAVLSIAAAMLLAVVLTGVIIATRNSDNDDDAAGSDLPAAEDALASAASAFSDTKSFHFRLSLQDGTVPLPLGLEMTSAEGDVVLPSSLSAAAKTKAGNLNLNLDVISVDNSTWVTNPFSSGWQKLSGVTLRDIVDPAELVAALLEAMQEPEIKDGPSIDGADTYQISGKVDSSELEEALMWVEPGFRPAVDLWLGVDDSLPRRARIDGPLAAEQDDDIIWQIDFSRYNQDFDIRAPQ